MLRLLKILFFSFIIGISVYIVADFAFVCLPKVIDLSVIQNVAGKAVFQKTGMQLYLKGLEIKTFHHFKVKVVAEEISLKNREKAALFVKKAGAKISLSNLFLREINISDISISELNADILNFPLLSGEKIPFAVKVTMPVIENFNVHAGKLFSITGNGDEKGSLKGTVSSDKNMARFEISKKNNNVYEGYVRNADLKVMEPILTFMPFIANSEGIVNFAFNLKKAGKEKYAVNLKFDTQDILLNSDNPYEKIYLPGKNLINTEFVTDFKDIRFSNFTLTGDGLDIYADGEIKNLKNPELNVNTKLQNTRAEKVVDLLPGVAEQIKKVKYYGVSGSADGFANIKGRFPNPEIVGAAEVKDIHALRGEEKSHVGEVSLNFKKTRVFTDLFVKASNGGTFSMKGNSELKKNGESSFEMNTTGNMPLALVSKILTPVADIFELRLGPVPFIKISEGFGRAKLSVEGTKQLAFIDGFVNIENAKGVYEGIGADLSEVTGDVLFKHDIIEFMTKKAKADNSYVKLNGKVFMAENNLDMEISSGGANSADVKNIVFASPLLKDIKEPLKDITSLTGKSQFKVTMQGKFDPELPVNSPEALQNLKTKGFFKMINNTCSLSYFDGYIENITGTVDFTEKTIDFENLILSLGNSLFSVSGKMSALENSKMMQGDVKIISQNGDVNGSVIAVSKTNIKGFEHIANNFSYLRDLYGKYDADVKVKIKNSKPDFSEMNAVLTFKPFGAAQNRLTISSGSIKIKNESAVFNNVRVKNGVSEIKAEGSMQNVYNPEKYEIWASAENFDLKYLHQSALAGIFGEEARKNAKLFKSVKGKISGSIKLSNKNDNGSIRVKNLETVLLKPQIPFNFADFSANFKNSVISIKNLKADVAKTFPVTGSITVSDYKSIPFVSGDLKLLPSSDFVEKFINPNLSYPIRVTGKPDITVNLNGKTNNLNAKILTVLNKGDDVSFYSANIGDINKERQINVNLFLNRDYIDIKEYKLAKEADNDKNFVPYLYGTAVLKNYGDYYKPVSGLIKTNGRVPAGLLNILFKKSLIKNGEFECSMSFNTGSPAPVSGEFNAYDLSVPLYETFLKTLKISADKNFINIHSEAKSFNSDFKFFAKAVNKISVPVKITTLILDSHGMQDLEKIFGGMYKMSIDAYENKTLKNTSNFDISNLTVNSGEIKIDNATFKTAALKNIALKFYLDNNSILRIKTNDFGMAEGKVNFTGKYDFRNGKANAEINAYDVNSDKITEAFLNLKGQMEGKLDGRALLSTRGFKQTEKLKNLNGTVKFSLKEGKMTRLGSLEYLLRAANIVSSGLTALSVHNVIALITPVNKGEFSKINGNFDVKNGILENIEIYSKGTHLSTFIEGTYDFAQDDCDINVYGKFGKKVSGILGPVGDMSVNAFFNLIPFIGNENKEEYEQFVRKIPDVTYKGNDYRIFEAEIQGSVNDSGSVKSFRWVK